MICGTLSGSWRPEPLAARRLEGCLPAATGMAAFLRYACMGAYVRIAASPLTLINCKSAARFVRGAAECTSSKPSILITPGEGFPRAADLYFCLHSFEPLADILGIEVVQQEETGERAE